MTGSASSLLYIVPMESNPEIVARDARVAVAERPPRVADRFKPRMSVRLQLASAAAMWLVASMILGVRGALWIGEADAWWSLFALALFAGVLKARFLLDGVASRAARRIVVRGRDACAGGFLSWRSWVLVLAMVAGGHALRLTDIPHSVLGVLYLAVALGLLFADRIYWREAIHAG